ncbi:TPA: hypothetical protein ACQ99F_001632 [Streptococcus pyogenes]
MNRSADLTSGFLFLHVGWAKTAAFCCGKSGINTDSDAHTDV